MRNREPFRARALVRQAEEAQQVVELHRQTQPKGPSDDLARQILSALAT